MRPVPHGASGRRLANPRGKGIYSAPIVVNAAGAWADEVAILAGVRRWTLSPAAQAMLVEAPPGIDRMPLTIDMAEEFYFKPDAGKLLLSPADETPSPPLRRATRRTRHCHCHRSRPERDDARDQTRVEANGLACAALSPDRGLVFGFGLPLPNGFFWLAGQGGYGIQTTPAASRLAARLSSVNRCRTTSRNSACQPTCVAEAIHFGLITPRQALPLVRWPSHRNSYWRAPHQ